MANGTVKWFNATKGFGFISSEDGQDLFASIDYSGRISFDEFRTAIRALEIGLNTTEEIRELFQQFDTMEF